MNRLEIFNIIRPIVASVTGVTNVILADQVRSDGSGLPSPNGEYIVIEPSQSISERGQANIYRSTSAAPLAIDVEIRAQIIVEVSINVFRGVDALSRVSRLLQCNKRPDVSATLFRNKLGWNRTSAPNNLTRLQSGNPEQRAQIYLYLMYETRDPVVINNIESASYEIQYEDGQVIASGTAMAP
jgi:hypothetical protein